VANTKNQPRSWRSCPLRRTATDRRYARRKDAPPAAHSPRPQSSRKAKSQQDARIRRRVARPPLEGFDWAEQRGQVKAFDKTPDRTHAMIVRHEFLEADRTPLDLAPLRRAKPRRRLANPLRRGLRGQRFEKAPRSRSQPSVDPQRIKFRCWILRDGNPPDTPKPALIERFSASEIIESGKRAA